jgi:DNA-binding SARP family transcriptional activator
VARDERVLAGLDAGKAQELFCYLLLHRDRSHPRETLANLLWVDVSADQSKKYLRKALWQLQAAIHSHIEPITSHVLLVEPDWVHLNPNADLWLDVAMFEQAFALVQGLPGRELDAAKKQALQGAVQLYQGDLLEGWYQDWCLYERKRLQNMFLAMLDKLMGYCEAHHEYETGLDYGARILHYDQAQERTHRRLMRLHHLAGDRTAALRQYEYCVAALDADLGVKPAKRTIALYDQIRADQLEGPAFALVEAPAALEAPPPLTEVLSDLQQLWTVLADLQRRVQRDIQAVAVAMNRQH